MKDDRYEKAGEALELLLSCDTQSLKEVMRKYRIYREGLFQHCSFKVGDRVIVTGFVYGNPDHGAYASDASLMKGAVGTVVEVDWHEYRKKEGGYFCCMFAPDFECWINKSRLQREGWKNSGELGELGKMGLPLSLSSDHHHYFMEEKALKHLPEGYDESTLFECRTCGWRGSYNELAFRPVEGYTRKKHWCPAKGCDNSDGGYPATQGFELLASPALRWPDLERLAAEGGLL